METQQSQKGGVVRAFNPDEGELLVLLLEGRLVRNITCVEVKPIGKITEFTVSNIGLRFNSKHNLNCLSESSPQMKRYKNLYHRSRNRNFIYVCGVKFVQVHNPGFPLVNRLLKHHPMMIMVEAVSKQRYMER